MTKTAPMKMKIPERLASDQVGWCLNSISQGWQDLENSQKSMLKMFSRLSLNTWLALAKEFHTAGKGKMVSRIQIMVVECTCIEDQDFTDQLNQD